MCIRDSNSGNRQAAIDWGTAVVVIPDEPSDKKIFEQTINSVSYTHLRAHETVLDLVCRLLLEKKKKIKQKHTYTLNHRYTNYHAQYAITHILTKT